MNFTKIAKLGIAATKVSALAMIVMGITALGCDSNYDKKLHEDSVKNSNVITAGVSTRLISMLGEPIVSTECVETGGLMQASLTDDAIAEKAFEGSTLYTNKKAKVYMQDKDTTYCYLPEGVWLETEGFESEMFAFTVNEDIFWVKAEDLSETMESKKILTINSDSPLWEYYYLESGEKYDENDTKDEEKDLALVADKKKNSEVSSDKNESEESDYINENIENTDSFEAESSGTEEAIDASTEGASLGVYKLTAYCNCAKCCGKWAGGPTKSGAMPVAGTTVACNTLAMGTKISINGHEYVVQDTGHLADNQIDVFFDSHSAALDFGVQRAEVFLCE